MFVLITLLTNFVTNRLAYVEDLIKAWLKPRMGQQVTSVFTDLTRSKPELIAENAFLRQQLVVLQRQVERPKLTQQDRRILVLLASGLRTWKNALFIVQPDTLLKWHRQGFRLFWQHKSKKTTRRQPRISQETIALIKEMTISNRLWGAKRIRGELGPLIEAVR